MIHNSLTKPLTEKPKGAPTSEDQTKIDTPKPPKPEEKPFHDFLTEEFIPGLENGLQQIGLQSMEINLEKGERPVVGGTCWMIVGILPTGRRFWLCFSSESIGSKKTISLAEAGAEPSLLESFLIDEKKMTKALLVSRLLQRLNGQKWLGNN